MCMCGGLSLGCPTPAFYVLVAVEKTDFYKVCHAIYIIESPTFTASMWKDSYSKCQTTPRRLIFYRALFKSSKKVQKIIQSGQ